MQEKYEKAMAAVAQMEKRVVMAESMLEATLQYESGQAKAQSSPRYVWNVINLFITFVYGQNLLKNFLNVLKSFRSLI